MRINQPIRPVLALLVTAQLCPLALQVQAAGDPARGRQIFAQSCAQCHGVRQGQRKMGPSLFAVVGRKAASLPDVIYSPALKSSGLTWTPDKLDAYLKSPWRLVPGGRMRFNGMADATARADLLAYLATLH